MEACWLKGRYTDTSRQTSCWISKALYCCSSRGTLTLQEIRSKLTISRCTEESFRRILINRVAKTINTSPQPVKSRGVCQWVVKNSCRITRHVEGDVRSIRISCRNHDLIDRETLQEIHCVLLSYIQIA